MPEQPQPSHLLRVLIVDDQASVRHALAAFLSLQQEIEVVGEAANGCEAVELARRCIPHVVLMDIEMPLMDGIEATRWIKQVLPHVRVVMLSLHDELRGRARQKGADDFLVKGEPPERLLELLGRLHQQVEAESMRNRH
jgi:DNA-binding NarL/FixJ family response regulator